MKTELSPELITKAKRAARNAWDSNAYGNGRHDWQSAEVACCTVIERTGFSHDFAYEEGRMIAAEVVSALEEEEFQISEDGIFSDHCP